MATSRLEVLLRLRDEATKQLTTFADRLRKLQQPVPDMWRALLLVLHRAGVRPAHASGLGYERYMRHTPCAASQALARLAGNVCSRRRGRPVSHLVYCWAAAAGCAWPALAGGSTTW